MVAPGCAASSRFCSLLILAITTALGSAQTLPLPPRPSSAPAGSQFIALTTGLPLSEREDWILGQVLAGNVPDFCRSLTPVHVSGTINGVPHSLVYYVMPDYLAVGSDSDYFLQPATPLLAQRLADALGCTLPTRKMVNQIWTNAVVKLMPQPIPPSPEMITVPVFAQHNALVRSQRDTFTNAFPLGSLVSGDKKDIVVSGKIYTNFSTAITNPVVIYGWHSTTGVPIQPLYNGHEQTYADYSHGVRLVQNAITLDGALATITNLLTNPNLAALLSDEASSEGTTNSVISKPRYTIGPLFPTVLVPPRSRTLSAGSTLRFECLAAGQSPLAYQWKWNGMTLMDATNSSLILSNVQTSQAGLYSVLVTNTAGSITSRPALLRIDNPSHPVLFHDDFEINSASSWILFWGASNGIPDYTAQWNLDYGTLRFTFNGATGVIPPSPNSVDGVPHGLRLSVNNDTNGSIAGVNVYPRDQVFADDLALKFDMWLNYPGGPGGSNATGSTQHAIFGLNHLATQANWAAPTAAASDGLWFAVDGEGGTSRDYRAYLGNPSGPATELINSSASGLAAADNSAPVYQGLFPLTRFETVGAPGKQWVEVELRQKNNLISWVINGTVIAQRPNTSGFISGTVMLGLMDVFNSIANPAADSFVLFDNVRVEDLSDRIRFLRIGRGDTGEIRLVVSVVPGKSCTVEWSNDLAVWSVLGTQQGSAGPLEFVDQAVGVAGRRFYRAYQQAP